MIETKFNKDYQSTCAFWDGVTRQHIAVLDNIASSVKAFR